MVEETLINANRRRFLISKGVCFSDLDAKEYKLAVALSCAKRHVKSDLEEIYHSHD
jgi:hypothetical protein